MGSSIVIISLKFKSFLVISLNLIYLREQENISQYGNIMYDRRVIRGNTYALNTLPAVIIPVCFIF
jgi:hypothetical protein